MNADAFARVLSHASQYPNIKMPKSRSVQELEAQHGEKMIELKIRFWTNDIAGEAGKIIPKHAWASGVVRMERNGAHDIRPRAPLPFHSLLDLGAVVERALIDHGIKLHINRKMRKYVDSDA